MSLPCLLLRHSRRSGDADPAVEAVAGSDPPVRQAWMGIGEDGNVHRHPPRCRGVTPGQQSRAGRSNGAPVRRVPVLDGDAAQPIGQPVGGQVLRRLEAALDYPSGTDRCPASDPEGAGAEGAQAHPAPNPYQALGLGGRYRHGPSGSCATGDQGSEGERCCRGSG